MDNQCHAAPEPERARHSLRWLGWVFAIIFIVYPLSTGPALLLYNSGIVPQAPLREIWIVVYSPLDVLLTANPEVKRGYQWYLHLWAPTLGATKKPATTTQTNSPSPKK